MPWPGLTDRPSQARATCSSYAGILTPGLPVRFWGCRCFHVVFIPILLSKLIGCSLTPRCVAACIALRQGPCPRVYTTVCRQLLCLQFLVGSSLQHGARLCCRLVNNSTSEFLQPHALASADPPHTGSTTGVAEELPYRMRNQQTASGATPFAPWGPPAPG